MKKSLVALAVLGSFGAFVCAESNVTLYGLLDEGVLVAGPNHGGTKVSIGSGFTAGSRFGFRGVEDLGGGNKVGFILEQGINVDTGNAGDSSKSFNRESALYVEGGWGRLTMGRLGTLGFAQSTNILRGAIFGTTYGASQWGVQDLNFSRVDNAIAYRTPNFGGFSVHAMYSNKMSGDDAANKFSLNNHYYGLGVLYAGGDINGSITLEARDNKEGTWAGETGTYHLTIGGSWKLGMVTPQAIYQYQWGTYRQHAAQIGVAADCAGGTAMLGFKYVNRNGDDRTFEDGYENASVWNVGAAYAYPLSKRTKVYGYAGYTDGNKGWATESFKTDYQYNGWSAGIGMVHNF